MLILQIPRRVAQLPTASFPAQLTIDAKLGPAEVFGEEALTGKTRGRPLGQEVTLTTDPFFGGVTVTPGGRFPPILGSFRLFDLTVTVEGTRATTAFQCLDKDSFTRAVSAIAIDLPALLSTALRSPVEVLSVCGRLGGTDFVLGVSGTFERHLETMVPAERISALFSSVSGIEAGAYPRFLSALRYLLQARRLDFAQVFSGQFLGERLLNIYKAVEVLFGRDTSILRQTLRDLGLSDDFIEVIVSLVYIRDEVDVGHPAILMLGADEYATVHSYAETVEEIVSWLLETLPSLDHTAFAPVRGSSKRTRTLAHLAATARQLNFARPDTFFRPSHRARDRP